MIGLLLILIVVTGLTGALLLTNQRNANRATAAQAAVVGKWQSAQAALMSGDDRLVLALTADVRLSNPDFEPTAVKSLRIAACTNLARAAEASVDIPAAQAWWECVLEEDPGAKTGQRGSLASHNYLAGQTALQSQDFAGAIAVWQPLFQAQPGYGDLKRRLYDAYLAYGDLLCAQQKPQDGQAQYVAARAVDATRPEADLHLASCSP